MKGGSVRRDLAIATIALMLASTACAPRAMRGGEGTENPSMDQPAMSTQLDKKDIDYLVEQNLDALWNSRFWAGEIRATPKQEVFAIWPIQNATSEHLDDQMLTLLSSIETSLINTGEVQVVARARQAELAREIGVQQGGIYDQSKAALIGRQVGAKYFVTGKLTNVDEKIQNTRRVQYSLFLQVIEIETGYVKFQNETARSKALKR